jgi:NADH-quinone oxidoreductase subunit J
MAIFFMSIGILSSFFVILSINPIYSILFLILAFINASGLLFLIGEEFLAITILLVYVGAVAILFLFVVMMLNIKIIISNANLVQYLPIGLFVSVLLIIELFIITWQFFQVNNLSDTNLVTIFSISTSMIALSKVIYTVYYDYFILSGYILLISVICAVLLTLRISKQVKKQHNFFQIYG